MFDRVLVPRAVYFELSDEGLRSQLEAVGFDLGEVSVDEPIESLDTGETAAITLAMEYEDAVLLTDGLDARDAPSDWTSRFTDRSGSSWWHTHVG